MIATSATTTMPSNFVRVLLGKFKVWDNNREVGRDGRRGIHYSEGGDILIGGERSPRFGFN
jgi:hypothetical protein